MGRVKFSSLIEKLPTYPFAKVRKVMKEVEKERGVKIIDARIGIPDVEAPKAIKKIVAKYLLKKNSTYGYPIDVYPERGIDELVSAIIEDYKKRYNVKLQPENIAITSWSKYVLHNLPRLLAPGRILIPEPIYPAYVSAVILSQHQVKFIPTSAENNWLPKFEFKQGDVGFYFCDPNNPTGAVADEKFYSDLLKKVKKSGVIGIFDKAYKDYVFDNKIKPISITQIPGLINFGYEVVSFSKHYNFVGLGLGFIVSSKENIDRWLKFADQFSQGVEWYKQQAGVEALNNFLVRKEIRKYFAELKERRKIFIEGLNELGLKCSASQATPYLWIKTPPNYEDDEKFVLEKLIPEAYVAFMPGSYFGKSGRGYFRATLFVSRNNIKEILRRIKNVKDW